MTPHLLVANSNSKMANDGRLFALSHRGRWGNCAPRAFLPRPIPPPTSKHVYYLSLCSCQSPTRFGDGARDACKYRRKKTLFTEVIKGKKSGKLDIWVPYCRHAHYYNGPECLRISTNNAPTKFIW